MKSSAVCDACGPTTRIHVSLSAPVCYKCGGKSERSAAVEAAMEEKSLSEEVGMLEGRAIEYQSTLTTPSTSLCSMPIMVVVPTLRWKSAIL